jgi:hypothetical protein
MSNPFSWQVVAPCLFAYLASYFRLVRKKKQQRLSDTVQSGAFVALGHGWKKADALSPGQSQKDEKVSADRDRCAMLSKRCHTVLIKTRVDKQY